MSVSEPREPKETRIYHEDHADTKDDSREQLETQRDHPGRVRLPFTGAADVVRACARGNQLRGLFAPTLSGSIP